MQQDRGREAEAPWRITARGWADILYRVWKDTGKKNLSLVAGGVTYYLLLALPRYGCADFGLRSSRGPGGYGEKRPVAVGYAFAIDRKANRRRTAPTRLCVKQEPRPLVLSSAS